MNVLIQRIDTDQAFVNREVLAEISQGLLFFLALASGTTEI
jgi:D-Tyr-tRNAtyr deacylase